MITSAKYAWLALMFTVCTMTAQNVIATVDADKPINVLTRNALGVMMQVTDPSVTDPGLPQLLIPDGLRTIRYPDGWNGQADLYHWSTYRPNKWGNSNPPRTVYYPPQNDFGHFAKQLDRIGSALITVNYGSNMVGNAGGDPVEAAAWIAYANGDLASTTALGKDASGHDWNTVGYWATMRASTPLTDDDGYNFLRIGHPAPFHIELWEVGDQVYNNGYYGGEHRSETDWHATYPDSEKENGRRHRDPNLSPDTYGIKLAEFSRAMKAVDSSIMVGASMVLPSLDSSWAPDWDQEVLKTSCQSIDFVSLQWTSGNMTLPPDWKHMDETDLLKRPEMDLPQVMSELLNLYKRYCPAGHSPKVAFSQVGYQSWDIMDNAQAGALFAADSLALLAEMGSVNADWYQFHSNSLYTDDNKPLPPFYGIQMLHIVAFRPGDQFLSVKSSAGLVAVHATRRQDGIIGVMLVNKDPSNRATVKVVINGAQTQATGVRFDYGPEQTKSKSGPVKSELKMAGSSIVVSVSPYSIVDLLIPQAK
jgi:hypothetical protein